MAIIEKLITLLILKIQEIKSILVYGNGKDILYWLNVEDHIDVFLHIQTYGIIGEIDFIGGGSKISNLNIFEEICNLFNTIKTSSKDYKSLIKFF